MISAILGIILGFLGILHVYWGLGGVGGSAVVIPEIEGRPVFTPSRLACFLVAAALGVAAFLVLAQVGHVSSPFSAGLTTVGVVGVGVIFTLRAVGDFRLVGFTKRIRNTQFAIWDTRLFSPLCLVIGLGSLWIALA